MHHLHMQQRTETFNLKQNVASATTQATTHNPRNDANHLARVPRKVGCGHLVARLSLAPVSARSICRGPMVGCITTKTALSLLGWMVYPTSLQ
jgi:hypothetical protein